MARVTRRIGLSLGADICWPICYEEILRQLDLEIEMGGDTLRFEVQRVTINPFSLRHPGNYQVVIDRLTHWYHTSREWIKKSILMDDLYVFNNPWSLQSMEKHTSYAAMMRLGFPVPDTWLIPPKSYLDSADLQQTLRQYARYFDLGKIGDDLGYPLFMKPYDGGAWVGVSKIDDRQALLAAYEESGTRVMNLQQAVYPYDRFVRCLGLGPQVRYINYKPDAPLHDRYGMERDFLDAKERQVLRDMTLTINAFFGWDFNSCEALSKGGIWHPIDFANGCPDSQVTSLHCHFPWLIKANLRWSLFCAATRRKMRLNLDWPEYFAIARKDLPFEDKLPLYARIARERFETERFEAFCDRHLSHLDEVAYDFFGSETARDAVRQKVAALFPEHETDDFTELFWQRVQSTRAPEARPHA